MAFQDGSNPFGSIVATIGGLAYVTENWEPSEPSNQIEIRNQVGAPSGWIAIPGFITGKVTMQLATSTYAVPTLGAIFTYPLDGSTATWVVVDRSAPQTQLDIQKVNVTVRKRLNS